MALTNVTDKYIPRDNSFYQRYYHYFILALIAVIFLTIFAVSFVLYQTKHRPLPTFFAVNPEKKELSLPAFTEPNLLPDTILRWASKAATAAYTFDFYNYREQIQAVRPYFTEAGWNDYLASVDSLINNIVQNQLFINGVVAGTPVISNQGELPRKGYVWRVQIPFLVTYQSANTTSKRNYLVTLVLVRVPTNENPQGIGIDQFVMT